MDKDLEWLCDETEFVTDAELIIVYPKGGPQNGIQLTINDEFIIRFSLSDLQRMIDIMHP